MMGPDYRRTTPDYATRETMSGRTIVMVRPRVEAAVGQGQPDAGSSQRQKTDGPVMAAEAEALGEERRKEAVEWPAEEAVAR